MKISYPLWINKPEAIVPLRYLPDTSCWYSIPACRSHSPPMYSCYNPKWAKPGNCMFSPLEFQLAPSLECLLQHLEDRRREMASKAPTGVRAGTCLWQTEVVGFSSALGHRRGAPHLRAVLSSRAVPPEVFEGAHHPSGILLKMLPWEPEMAEATQTSALPEFPKAAPCFPTQVT